MGTWLSFKKRSEGNLHLGHLHAVVKLCQAINATHSLRRDQFFVLPRLDWSRCFDQDVEQLLWELCVQANAQMVASV